MKCTINRSQKHLGKPQSQSPVRDSKVASMIACIHLRTCADKTWSVCLLCNACWALYVVLRVYVITPVRIKPILSTKKKETKHGDKNLYKMYTSRPPCRRIWNHNKSHPSTKPTAGPVWQVDSDQPVHPHLPSTARVLLYPSLDSPEAAEGTCDQRRLRWDCTEAQADLILRWSHKTL